MAERRSLVPQAYELFLNDLRKPVAFPNTG